MELSDLYASCLSDPELKEQYDELKQQHAEVTNKLEKDYKMAMASLAVTKNNEKRSIDTDFATKIDALMQKHHNSNALKRFISCNPSSVNSDDNSNINGLSTGVISIDEEESVVKSEPSSNENEIKSMDNNNIDNNNDSNVNVNDADINSGDEINQSIANSNSDSNTNDNDSNSDNDENADEINSEDEHRDNNNGQNNNDNNSSNNNSDSLDNNNNNDNDNDNDGAENKQQHSRDAEEKCKFCYCMFLDQKSLKKHQKSKHSGAKPYLCVRCKKRFNSRQKLSSHIRFSKTSGKCAFGPPKFFHCDQCDKKFKEQGYLNNHKKKHHS